MYRDSYSQSSCNQTPSSNTAQIGPHGSADLSACASHNSNVVSLGGHPHVVATCDHNSPMFINRNHTAQAEPRGLAVDSSIVREHEPVTRDHATQTCIDSIFPNSCSRDDCDGRYSPPVENVPSVSEHFHYNLAGGTSQWGFSVSTQAALCQLPTHSHFQRL